MKKKVSFIILAIVLALGIIVTTILYFLIPRDEPVPTEEKYILITNSNAKYKFISTYDDYIKFMEESKITKMDYYTSYNQEDFNGKKYLFYLVPFDSCSETIKSDRIKKEDNKYKIYLDMEYECGVCPYVYKVLDYEIDEELDVELYSKAVSREYCDPNVAYKPIIYIYPEEDMDLRIELGNKENLLYTYPKYNEVWNIRVTKDGNIYDYDTNRNYYALYWEGKDNYKLDLSKGFVVKGEDTVKFLEEKLSILGLNEYEINEFIIYWIDKLENNNYNFISFRDIEDINKSMPLNISSKPDTLIRVMMDYKPLNNYIEVDEQKLIPVTRSGFTIVEWGGTIHK